MNDTIASAQAVCQFWFGDGPPFAARPEWFRKSDAFDQEIVDRFGVLIEQALRAELPAWGDRAETALARVIVLDQFTRNAFRNSARSFAGDPLALAAARTMLAQGHDQLLAPVQRVFVYLPLEHAEDLETQEESVRLFTRLQAEAPDAQGWLAYASSHRDIIARFGRFPHRNAILGRNSTAEEVAFLKQPGSSF